MTAKCRKVWELGERERIKLPGVDQRQRMLRPERCHWGINTSKDCPAPHQQEVGPPPCQGWGDKPVWNQHQQGLLSVPERAELETALGMMN